MINRIELLISHILNDLLIKGPQTEIQLINNYSWLNTYIDFEHVLRMHSTEQQSMKIGKNLRQMKDVLLYKRLANRQRFVLFIVILGEVHDLLLGHSYCMYRELYYRNIEISSGTQMKIERAVNDISKILQTTPWNLGIFSSSKGLLAGSLIMHMSNGEMINCSSHNGATLVPSNFTYITNMETSASLILLIEKDTIFEKLLAFNIMSLISIPIILMTGRGYPDIATRYILKRLQYEFNLPIYTLTDGDPCGIEIMLMYRHGSLKQASYANELTCPQLTWLGIHPSDILLLDIKVEMLTSYDYKKIKSLLKRSYISESVKAELMILERLQCKAKLDNMSNFTLPLFISDYIVNKIKRQVVL